MSLRSLFPLLPAVFFAFSAHAEYRTIAVFPDTQDMVASDAGLGTNYLEQMVDWVVARKDSERIDMVLHVGDLIQNGGAYDPVNGRATLSCPASPPPTTDAATHPSDSGMSARPAACGDPSRTPRTSSGT